MNICPCESGKKYEDCCKKYIKGTLVPSTAELLMRSRYTAYVVGEIDYILKTHDPSTVSDISRDTVADWSESSKWEGLEIVKTKAGKVRDKKGIVEFKASYIVNDKRHTHHEKSLFVKIKGRWYYHGWAE
ncbi:YchJ family protein [uncultured Ilyobacter sp.]|uniref:YchJ family protein n=1 Tax=uncultured Ilyobacter sp. TaxID=544433 RepID=UPI002AA8F14D|nr:YchJ family protein [uncultured Ilyobacter sp.]